MKSSGQFHLILPASELVQEYQPSEYLLKTVGTNTKDLIEMFLTTWAECKNEALFPFGAVAQNCMSTNARLRAEDIIFSALERRMEQGDLPKLNDKDQEDAQKVMMAIWYNLSETVFQLIEELDLHERQVQQMHFVRWVGDDLVVSFPFFRTLDRRPVEKSDAKPTK